MNAYRLVSDDIIGSNYKKFLQLFISRATYFSLTFHHVNTKKGQKIKKELQPYTFKVLETFHWYCFTTLEKPLIIAIYFANEETMSILLKYYNTLYSKPQFGVEDICFFEETKLIFGSVSHVSSAHLFLSSSNDLLLYRQIANWEEENFPECDSVSIPK